MKVFEELTSSSDEEVKIKNGKRIEIETEARKIKLDVIPEEKSFDVIDQIIEDELNFKPRAAYSVTDHSTIP